MTTDPSSEQLPTYSPSMSKLRSFTVAVWAGNSLTCEKKRSVQSLSQANYLPEFEEPLSNSVWYGPHFRSSVFCGSFNLFIY